MIYRKEYNKIYNKINKIAQKGIDAIFDYKEYIDEIINNSQYNIFEDVMITKYSIDVRKYKTISDVKNNTFDEIRLKTNSSSQLNLNKLFNQKDVYQLGYNFFDNTTNNYLGDIIEIQTEIKSSYKYSELKTDLEVIKGLSSSIIPQFDLYINNNIYKLNDVVIYQQKIFECIQSYTYSSINKITPINNLYWSQLPSATYSTLLVDSDDLTLVQKYDLAIDYLKSI